MEIKQVRGKAINKDTIKVSGEVHGKMIHKVLLTNRIVEERKAYLIKMNNTEVVKQTMIGDVLEIETIG